MRIDCNEITIGISESKFELQRLKSGKLVKSLIDINSKMEPKRNYMIVSMNVFNILELHDRFEHLNLLGKEIESITLVGCISGLDCYVDLHMGNNNILLHYNKQVARNLKLESILDDNKFIDDSIEIEVIL
jgi:hypothetical protein